MFSRIQTRYYRSLKAVDQSLGAIQALVGPNASGKTTFLDVIGLLSDLVRRRGDVRDAILFRSANFEKLIWQGDDAGNGGSSFELAVEAPIPESIRARMNADFQRFPLVRYELEIGFDAASNEIGINHETLSLRTAYQTPVVQKGLFPAAKLDAPSIFLRQKSSAQKVVMRKVTGGNDNYYPDGAKSSYAPSFKLGRTKLALANIPADQASFPVSSWFKDLLEGGVQSVVLNSQTIRQPSPPGLGLKFQTDGSNLPWVIAELRKDTNRFKAWLDHVRTALEDIVDIDTVEREDDRHRYLVVKYSTGAAVPSWLVSDGTLRLLALTIPAYIHLDGVFLIEEPENGIHPRAIESVIQSLSSIYDGQVLIATHSPVALNLLEPAQVLCFAKDPTGATDIVSGDRHPALQKWRRGEPDLGVLFAAGILS